MKPKIFIGSSTESLQIAYAIHSNLEFDAEVTVWTQGIFKLSSNTIDDLLNVLSNCNYGIFVFSPDDIITIRESKKSITRDNVIFEIGLFVGKLGKDKVFYVKPRDENDLHIPTDLLAMTPGTYDANREDKNLIAALGPFCNQVRLQLKDFIYNNINDIVSESKESKRLAIERPTYWRQLFFSQLLEEKISPVIYSYEEIKKGIVFIPKTNSANIKDFFSNIHKLISDYEGLSKVFLPLMNDEFQSVMADESDSQPIEIKNFVEQIIKYCKELLAWEYRLEQLKFPKHFEEQKELLKGLCVYTLNVVAKVPTIMRKRIEAAKNGEDLNQPELMINTIVPIDQFEKAAKNLIEAIDNYLDNNDAD